jgi:hypothetical protein
MNDTNKTVRKVAPHKVHHERAKSSTLLRSVVKKPNLGAVHVEKGLVHQTQVALDQFGNQPIWLSSVSSPKPQQVKHAQAVHKNGLVSHFTPDEPKSTYPAVQTVDVKRAEPLTPLQESFEAKPVNPFDTAVARSNSHLEKPFRPEKARLSHILPIVLLGLLVIALSGFLIYRNMFTSSNVVNASASTDVQQTTTN